jgi:GNAT superfamily N-acetyltransferase
LRAADLPFCNHLRQVAAWNQTGQDWQRFLHLSPNGCFIAEKNGAPLGTVTTIEYGREIGWIGMLLVEPVARGQGIGKALLEAAIKHLQRQKVRCIKLDATPEGEPLYRKIGFQDEWPLTRFQRPTGEPATPHPSLRKLAHADLPRMISLDEQAFGAPRPALLRSLCDSSHVLGRDASGEIKAFGFLRPGSVANYLGSIVAQSTNCAEAIAHSLIGSSISKPLYWDVPAQNKSAARLAERLGFTPQRSLLRMFLGPENLTGNAQLYFGIADPSLG